MSRSTRSTRSARTIFSADDEHDRSIVRARVDVLRGGRHVREAAVWLHAQSLPQETVVTYRNSTALDIDWRDSVSDCWSTSREPTGRGVVGPSSSRGMGRQIAMIGPRPLAPFIGLVTALVLISASSATPETIRIGIGHQSLCTDTYSGGITVKQLGL